VWKWRREHVESLIILSEVYVEVDFLGDGVVGLA